MQRVMDVKLTGKSSNGVTFKVPESDVAEIVQASLGRDGLKRITIDWDLVEDLEDTDEHVVLPSAPDRRMPIRMMLSRADVEKMISDAFDAHGPPSLNIGGTAPLEDTDESAPHIETELSTTVQQTMEYEPDKDESIPPTMVVPDPVFETAPGVITPPDKLELPEPPSQLYDEEPEPITPFQEIERISFKELKDVKATNKSNMKFFPMGDGRIVIDYSNSKVYTTWVAIKELPYPVPDEMQGKLNNQKWHAVKMFKAWMIERAMENTDT